MVRRNPSLIAGGAIIALLALAAALGPLLVRADPLAIDLTRVLAPPSRGHWLGCDALGRDMLARVLWGARLSLAVSTTVVLLSLAVGSIVGGAAALAGVPLLSGFWSKDEIFSVTFEASATTAIILRLHHTAAPSAQCTAGGPDAAERASDSRPRLVPTTLAESTDDGMEPTANRWRPTGLGPGANTTATTQREAVAAPRRGGGGGGGGHARRGVRLADTVAAPFSPGQPGQDAGAQ